MLLYYCSLLETEEEKRSFEKIYEDNYLGMYHVAFQMLNSRERAEDAVHSAFLKLIEHFSKYSRLSCSKLASLCVIIVKNKAIDQIREQTRHDHVPFEDMEYQLPAKELQPEGRAILEEERNYMLRCLDQLPEKQKMILELQYYHGFNSKEIAEILDITKKNAQMRLYRAKMRLKEVYESGDVEGRV